MSTVRNTLYREHAAFLRACAEDPRDLFPRLVYADWLDEIGEIEQAVYLRLNVKLAEQLADPEEHPEIDVRDLRRQCKRLKKRGWSRWLSRYQKLLSDAGWSNIYGRNMPIRNLTLRHGLPELADCYGCPAPEWFGLLRELVPLREVTFSFDQDYRLPEQSRLQELDDMLVGIESVTLILTRAWVETDTQETLLTMMQRPQIREVYLYGCYAFRGVKRGFLDHRKIFCDRFDDYSRRR